MAEANKHWLDADVLEDLEGGKRSPTLVFVDMPECGGTMFDLGMPPSVVPRRDGPPLPDLFVGGPGGIGPEDVERLRDATFSLTMKGVRMLRGGFPFTISEFLAQFRRKREFRYITVLRDPVDRFLAHYWSLAPDRSLEDALETGVVQDNLQTRMLSGSRKPFGKVGDRSLDRAKENLRDRFAFFGIAERPEESLALARLRLGLGEEVYRNEPALSPPPVRKQLPGSAPKFAKRKNRYDIELYAFAQELFSTAPELEDVKVQCEVGALRARRGDAELEVTTRVPDAFTGSEHEWRLLVGARSECLDLKWALDDAGPAAAEPTDDHA